MDHRPTPDDDDLAQRLRAGIDAGPLPAPDLADVQRRADRRARRRAVGTAAVAGASALALVGVLAVTVPAINGVVSGRDPSSAAALGDRAAATADPSGDLVDPSAWSSLPAVREHEDRYLSPDVVDAAVGSGDWYGATADMVDPWTSRECSPSPLRDTAEADAGLGPRPASTHVEPWASQRLGPDGAPTTTVQGEPLDDFAEFAVLRWDPDPDGSASAWSRTIAQEAVGCPGAELVEPGASVGDEPAVVIARPYGEGVVGASEGWWLATAVVAGGPTALQVRYGGAAGAQEAGDGALALLQAGVRAVTAADRAAQGIGSGDRAGGVDDAQLADFTSTERWTTLPPLHTVGPPPRVPLHTSADLDAAFSGTRSWESGSIGGTGTDWLRSWCAADALVDGRGDGDDGTAPIPHPADEMASVWQGRSGVSGRPRVDVDVLRWRRTTPAVDDAGADLVDRVVALEAADDWGTAVVGDATACPGVVVLDPAGLPGARATLTALDDDGRWRVQAVTVGGPTAVRVQATVEADGPYAAGDRAVAMARRVVANVVRADDVEQGRPNPGPLP